MRDLHALERATDGLRLAGGTDRAFARRMLARVGLVEDEGAITRVLDAYVEHLDALLRTRRYRPIGDVPGTVAALAERGAVIGVATGNVRGGAELKLRSAGLAATFDLARGGFGCDAELRADIVRIAADRCGGDRPSEVVVVGDTEHDVRAARAIGARIVGVAANEATRIELEAAGADAIVTACGPALVDAVLA